MLSTGCAKSLLLGVILVSVAANTHLAHQALLALEVPFSMAFGQTILGEGLLGPPTFALVGLWHHPRRGIILLELYYLLSSSNCTLRS